MAYSFNDPRLHRKMWIESIKDREELALNPKQLELFEELAITHARKNKDYGDSFAESLDEDGLIASVTRMGDKYRRFRTLTNTDDILVGDESMRDTLMDLANYAVMTVMWLEEHGGSEGLDMHDTILKKNEEISALKKEIRELKERLEQVEMDYIYSNNGVEKNFRELGEEGTWSLYQDSHMNNKELSIMKDPDSYIDLGFTQLELPLWKTEELKAKKKEDLARLRRIYMDIEKGKALKMNDIYDKKRLHSSK